MPVRSKGKRVGKVYLGIDPGKQGGLALITQSGIVLDSIPMPLTELDLWSWISKKKGVTKCVIEKVHAMPNQGVTSMFTFGEGFGRLKMAATAASIPFELVPPRTWQKGLGIKARDTKKESKPQFKERLRTKAQQLFPKLEVWNGTLGLQRSVCDALLIAEYARKVK